MQTPSSNITNFSVGQTCMGIVLAFVIWGVVRTPVYTGLYLLEFRGLVDGWFQATFRDWFSHGLGGFAAIYTVGRFLRKANLKWVGIGLCTPLFLFILYVSIFYSYSFDWRVHASTLSAALATILGVYLAHLLQSKAGKPRTPQGGLRSRQGGGNA